MRRKYLSLLLAAVISLTQIAGTGQYVQASEVSGEIGQEAPEGTTNEDGQEPPAGTEEGAEPQPEEPQPPAGTGQIGYAPNFNLPDENKMVLNHIWSIPKNNGGFWMNADGSQIEMQIKNVVSAN